MRSKLLLIIPFLLLSATAVSGEQSVAKAEITFGIINEAPVITHISLSPAEAFVDEPLECEAEVEDEHPDLVTYSYIWYVNGHRVDHGGESFYDFEEGDEVTCVMVPSDIHQAEGNPRKASTSILEAKATTKAWNTVIEIIGGDSTYAETAALQEKGIGSITGFVAGEGMKKAPAIPALAFLVVILLIINLNLLMRQRVSAGAST